MNCKCCQNIMLAHMRAPNVLVPIPFESHGESKEPAWLCRVCDGDALPLAFERLKEEEGYQH